MEPTGEKLPQHIDTAPLVQLVEQVQEQIGKVVVGQRNMIDLLLAGLLPMATY